MPEEETLYTVRIAEEERLYLSSELEPVLPPSGEVVRYSPEWNAAMHRWLEAGQRWLANSKDRAAWDQFSEAGRKLGWHVPIKPDPPGK